MWKHTENHPPLPAPLSKVVYLGIVHWRINRIQEMVISLLYHLRICPVFRNQSLGTILITLYLFIFLMKCILSPYFAHDPHQHCTKFCGIKPLGLLVAACLFLSSSDSLLSCCLNGMKRESWEKRECWGQGLVRWNSCASLFKAVGMVIFHSFICYNFYWSIVALKRCVGFHCTAKWISYRYTYIPSLLDFLPI